jgi:hypothetical protein
VITSVRNIIRDPNFVKVLGNPFAQPLLQFGKNITGDVQLRLINSMGQIVWEKRLSNIAAGQMQIVDMKGIAKGVYTVVITSKEGVVTKKLMN